MPDEGVDLYKKALRYFGIKQYEKAGRLFEKSLSGLEASHKTREVVIALKMAAICNSKLKAYDRAERLIKKSLELAEKAGLQEELGKIYQSYSIVAFKRGKNKEALDYIEKSLASFPGVITNAEDKKQKEKYELGRCISLYGLKEYSRAETCLLRLHPEVEQKQQKDQIKEYLAMIYYETGKDREARELVDDLLERVKDRPSLYVLSAKLDGVCESSNRAWMKAVSLSEKELGEIENDDFRISYVESNRIYTDAIDCLLYTSPSPRD